MIILVLILGLIAGSFLTAFVDRIHDGRDFIKKRSTCDKCHKVLGLVDLIPLISFIVLRGKCRHCQASIGYSYLLIEALTTLTFVGFYMLWPFSFEGLDIAIFFSWLVILTLLLALAIYDLKWMILPNQIIYPAIVMALIVLNLRLLGGHDLVWWNMVLGIALGGGIFYLIFLISDKLIGFGDVRLGFLLGILLLAGQLSVLMIFISSVLGVLTLLPLLVIKGKQGISSQTKLPYGPFLILGGIISFSLGFDIIGWYLSLV